MTKMTERVAKLSIYSHAVLNWLPSQHNEPEPERMFSKMDSTLTEIRSTMSEDRLEPLVLMQAHRKRVTELAINDITSASARRISRHTPSLFSVVLSTGR